MLLHIDCGLKDTYGDGINDARDYYFSDKDIEVKSYYYPNTGFSVYECPFKPGYFNKDPVNAIMGKTQCFH